MSGGTRRSCTAGGNAGAERGAAWRRTSEPRPSSTGSARPTTAGRRPGVDEESAISALIQTPSKTAAGGAGRDVGYLGAGFATLINLFNPERIVLGGWTGLALGERFMAEIRAATAEHALRQPFAQTSIVLCKLGQDAVALGAATLPVARLLNAGGSVRA